MWDTLERSQVILRIKTEMYAVRYWIDGENKDAGHVVFGDDNKGVFLRIGLTVDNCGTGLLDIRKQQEPISEKIVRWVLLSVLWFVWIELLLILFEQMNDKFY